MDYEKMGYEYNYFYRYDSDSWFHTWYPNTIAEYNTNEFHYTNSINEWGHREKPLEYFTDNDSSFLILCLGDSFTEGDGAPYDSTWVRRLEYHLNKNYEKHFTLYNAGVCGSDIVFNYKILEQKLLNLNPRIVLEMINTSDISDIMYLGGNERFNEDGTGSGKVGPNWERFYKHIHVFRMFVHTFLGYNQNLVKKKEEQELIDKAIEEIVEQISVTANWCNNNDIPYIAFLQPTPGDIFNKDLYFRLSSAIDKQPFIIDLSINMYPFFRKNKIEAYRWDENGHFNGKGYFLLGDFVFKSLRKKQLFNESITQENLDL